MLSATSICRLVYAIVLVVAGQDAGPQCAICTSITVGELLQVEREPSPSDFSFV